VVAERGSRGGGRSPAGGRRRRAGVRRTAVEGRGPGVRGAVACRAGRFRSVRRNL